MEKIRTLDDIKNIGLFNDDRYDSILDESSNIMLDNPNIFRNMDISDTPISPMSLDDSNKIILLAPDILQEYNNIIKKINNPSTALEYGYLLVGRKIKNDDEEIILIEYIFDISKKDNTNNRSVQYDNARLNNIVKALSEAGCDFMSICHTHPLIPEDERKTTIAHYLSEDTLKHECIRDAGLNLSLQDIISYKSLYNQAKTIYPNVEFLSTVIMYNGEIAMMGIQDDELVRYVNIYEEDTKQPIFVSSSEEYRKNHNKAI